MILGTTGEPTGSMTSITGSAGSETIVVDDSRLLMLGGATSVVSSLSLGGLMGVALCNCWLGLPGLDLGEAKRLWPAWGREVGDGMPDSLW